MPFDAFIGALTSIDGFAEIVLPYISATNNSTFDITGSSLVHYDIVLECLRDYGLA